MTKVAKLVLLSMSVYLMWVFATYMLEGRVNLLQRIDPVGRMEYAIIANILIGTVIGLIILKPFLRSKVVTQKQLGFQSPKRIIILVAVAAFVGFLFYFNGNPASFNPIVVANIFSQTLPTSIAEVVVCWIVVGGAFEALARRKMKKRDDDGVTQVSRTQSAKTVSILAVLAGATISIVLFGIYHSAHSSPFNEPMMMVFLMGPAVLTSIFYFVVREIYSTITVHNFLALVGVMSNIDIIPLSQLIYPVIMIALASVLVLIVSDLFLIRRIKINYESQ